MLNYVCVDPRPGHCAEERAVEMNRPRRPRVECEEEVQLEGSGEGLAWQEEGGHHQEVEGRHPAQDREGAETPLSVYSSPAQPHLMWKLAVASVASVRSCRLNCSLVPVTARLVRALRMRLDWKTRQPVTLLNTTPVLAKPAMKWRRQGQPQKMEMKTMMKVVILAMCSSSLEPRWSRGTS